MPLFFNGNTMITFNVLDGRFCHDQIIKDDDEIDQ